MPTPCGNEHVLVDAAKRYCNISSIFGVLLKAEHIDDSDGRRGLVQVERAYLQPLLATLLVRKTG